VEIATEWKEARRKNLAKILAFVFLSKLFSGGKLHAGYCIFKVAYIGQKWQTEKQKRQTEKGRAKTKNHKNFPF
jgi:hypothetical protein